MQAQYFFRENNPFSLQNCHLCFYEVLPQRLLALLDLAEKTLNTLLQNSALQQALALLRTFEA